MAEGVGGVIGREVVDIEPDRAAATDDFGSTSRAEAEPDLAGHAPLRRGHERRHRLAQWREPHAVVDELGETWLEARLLVGHITFQGQSFQVGVRHDKGERTRALVDLSALDSHAAPFDHVDTAEADRAGHTPDLANERHEAELGPVEGDRNPLLEAHGHLDRLDRHRHRQCKDVLRRRDPRVLQDPALDRPSPDVRVDGVDPVLAHRYRDVVALGVVDRLLAGHPPDAHRSQHLEIWC